jgi:hypothetical protein
MDSPVRFAAVRLVAAPAPFAAQADDALRSEVTLTARATFSSRRVPEISDLDDVREATFGRSDP